ncbi:hypothetical protein F2Q70_00014135 [Brassica cretica]|uniref:ATP-dependent RNA helicase n=2 Tax=Brassica TaxID=3705 RepID=A0A8S9I035_BRACR|nr:hypothetical protein F2Q70_00014135 [Brassica cretica]
MIASLDRHFSLIYMLLKRHIADIVDYKVIIFCTTAMVTRMVADLFGQLSLNVREIHSRKPQGYRTRVSDEFRKSKSIILVTSDVSARGLDYPDVSLVVQMGLPLDRKQYIHRLGRTGREDKEGEGVLLLAPWEEYFLSSVKDLPITKASLPQTDPEAVKKVKKALRQVDMKNKEAAYQAWLGYYTSQKKIARDTTRLVELANEFSRTAAEAKTLLKYHSSIGVDVVIGGKKLRAEQRRMQKHPCRILVATPGRLIDHIDNTPGFARRLRGVKVLVLDEADHLLDMGFRRDVERIISAVPKKRQTFLFSATVPEEVRQICHVALKQDHEFVNCVQEGSDETHQKVIIFCTTAMVTRMVADLLGQLSLNVREIHSRKPQGYRTRVSDEFRKSKSIILVTSDVSSRGLDYPDVSLVIQMGLPSDRKQYIHRLGRTGREDKEGEGVLLLAPWEEYFLSSVKDLPITKASLPQTDPEAVKKVKKALRQVDMKNKEAAYQAWLGYYTSQKKIARDTTRLVELANEFSRSMGLSIPPAIPVNVLDKMGLKNVPGLRVAPGS